MTIEPDNRNSRPLNLALDQRQGVLKPADAAALAGDPALAREVEEASGFLDRLREARVALPEGHVDRVLEQVGGESSGHPLLKALWPTAGDVSRRRLALRRSLAVAAGILIGVILHLGLSVAANSHDDGPAGDLFVLAPPR